MTTRQDAQLAEFEKRDLGADIRITHRGRSARAIAPDLNPAGSRSGRKAARERREARAGYQTMLKMIVAEHVVRALVQ